MLWCCSRCACLNTHTHTHTHKQACMHMYARLSTAHKHTSVLRARPACLNPRADLTRLCSSPTLSSDPQLTPVVISLFKSWIPVCLTPGSGPLNNHSRLIKGLVYLLKIQSNTVGNLLKSSAGKSVLI